jgi:hypothetical protein
MTISRHSRFCVAVCSIVCFFAVFPRPAQAAMATQSAEFTVGATVKPRTVDFQLGLNSSLEGSLVGADTEIEYTITYGSLLSYNTPMQIEAEWSLGSVPVENLYSYSIVSYVAGSASNDYWGKSMPRVDVTRRKIIWDMPAFPRNTIDKTLRFRLRTPGRYVTDRQVNFIVTARLITSDLTMPEKTLEQTYNPTEFIRKEVRGTTITGLDIRSITDTSFAIFLSTSVPTRAIVTYGTNPDDLSKSIALDELTDQKMITITGLEPVTTYYFKVFIENAQLIQRRTPEVFTVTTSSSSLLSLVDQERVIVTANGVLLNLDPSLGSRNSFLVPARTAVVWYIPFKKQIPTLVYLSVINQKVLGLSTDTPATESYQNLRFLESQTGIYTGSVMSPATPGIYDIVLETRGADGSINRDVVSSLIVSPPISVHDDSGKPIEDAMMYFERFSKNKQAYEHFPGESFGSSNPVYTKADGSISQVLPVGEYRMTVTALGYEPAEMKFTFSPIQNQSYPSVKLKSAPFSLLTYGKYLMTISVQSFRYARGIIDELGSSYRFLDWSLFITAVVLTILSTLFNLRRVVLSFDGALIRIERFFKQLFGTPSRFPLFAVVVQDAITSLPIYNAIVTVMVRDHPELTMRTITDVSGMVFLPLDPMIEYQLSVRKSGKTPMRAVIEVGAFRPDRVIVPMPHMESSHVPVVLQFIGVLGTALASAVSDTLMLSLLIFHILLVERLGIVRMAPMVMLSLLNFFLWAEYQWGRRRGR